MRMSEQNINEPGSITQPFQKRRFVRWSLLLALGFWLLAATTRFYWASQLTLLSARYSEETRYAATSRARITPDGPWTVNNVISRRIGQALAVYDDVLIVQDGVHWTSKTGEVLFESSGIYGVDRHTRKNLSGYGNISRTGWFLFPPHVQQKSYPYWDSAFIGPRTAVFDRTATVNGVLVYVFKFNARDMDETAGYAHLPGVPERYQARTDGEGMLWVEPTSGVVVDYQEGGVSYFFDASSKKRIADLFIWRGRYTPQTKAAQLQSAIASRRRINLLEIWLPLGLLLCGFVSLAFAGLRSPRSITTNSARIDTGTYS